MQTGKSGMGMAKHRKSGRAQKSPAQRMADRLAAKKSERKSRPSTTTWADLVSDLMKRELK